MTRTVVSPPRSRLGERLGDRGLSLVEVLVALAILATVAVALVGLQVAGLRAARTAAQTRQLAASLRFEADLARVVTTSGDSCRSAPGDGTCTVSATCLDVTAEAGACQLRIIDVELSTPAGRRSMLTTVGYSPLEWAPVGPPLPPVTP